MGEELKFPGGASRRDEGSLDDSVVELIRDAYSPPGDEAYWAALENRIMARVSSADREVPWWNVLAPWAKPALIAAAAIFALAGLVNQQLVESDSQFAYDSVLQSSTPEVVSNAEELISVERGVDGATISYFLSH